MRRSYRCSQTMGELGAQGARADERARRRRPGCRGTGSLRAGGRYRHRCHRTYGTDDFLSDEYLGLHAFPGQVRIRSLTDRLEITRERAIGHTETAFNHFCSALRAVTNPQATAVGTWTIRDVAGHLRGSFDLYPDLLAGPASPLDSPQDITSFNDKVVAGETRSVPELADAIEARLPDFVAAAR